MPQLQRETVQIPNGDLEIAAYVSYPVTLEPLPAVVVVQEIFGVNSHIRDVTDRVAQLGYVAIAPALYQRLAPGFEAGYTPADIQLGRQYKEQTKATELLSDLQATIDYLYGLPQVKQTGVGAIGFCFGGHVTYLGATLPAIKATASFYGAGITTWCPGESNRVTLDYTAQIQGKLYGFFGLADQSIPSEQIDQIEAALKTHQIEHRIFRYDGADHGFFCDRRASYNKQAAQAAWQEVQQLFATTL
ncbi:dienelactone hydrolase family protein [[Synechococcus] sp. NIES-970]|uniref:dienelactone hydrolase family protein n=1 Tax=Picosynechococcus sp. NKBG15041c TaxID=1407650 RepID=UPI000424042C|nr:dienelactone hydrolase family protein [Picosynechococcus sp. NKBG15041c]BAW97428.1 dienelactone hydrolase family protein [[Synechococcus] sp. NIES-970]